MVILQSTQGDVLAGRPWSIQFCLDSHASWGIITHIEQISPLHHTQPDQGVFPGLVRLDHCPQVQLYYGKKNELKREREIDWLFGWLTGIQTLTVSIEARESRIYFLLVLHNRKHGRATLSLTGNTPLFLMLSSLSLEVKFGVGSDKEEQIWGALSFS